MKFLAVGILALFPVLSFSQVQSNNDDSKLYNYEVCHATISKDGKELSKNLITTYRPSVGIRQLGNKTYHYPHVVVSDCVHEAFDDEYNKKNLYYDKKKKEFVGVCFVLGNGVEETEDGVGRFYIARHGTGDRKFELSYLNEHNPIIINGTDVISRQVGEYDFTVDCKNTMMTAFDPLWAKIKKDILGE